MKSSRTWIGELIDVPNFSPADVTMFHVLPDMPYENGVYEVTARRLAEVVRVSHPTASKFLQRLEECELVEVLRGVTARSRAGLAFTRKESTLHKNNYERSSGLRSVQGQNLYYIAPRIVLPKKFFKAPPSPNILRELLPLLRRDDLRHLSVHQIITEYITAPDSHSAQLVGQSLSLARHRH